MTKKLTNRFKRITSIALAMMLFVGMALPGFAAKINAEGALVGDEDHPAKAAITKLFKMPEGTVTPDVEFKFNIAATKVDGEVASLTNPAPEIPEVKAVFNGENGNLVDNVKIVQFESGDIFNGVDWKHSGIYVYEVTEVQKNNILIKTDPDMLEDELYYSQAKYELTVFVAQKANGDYYVQAIGALIKVIDNDDQVVDTKVDPTPGGGDDYDYSQMIFTNIFVENNGKDEPETPEEIDKYTVLKISKEVEGSLAEKFRDFEFEVTITKASIGVLDSRPYSAFIMEKDSEGKSKIVSTPADFMSGNKRTIELKHGQWIAFTDMPVGTYFVVDELGVANYKPSYTLIINGDDKGKVTGILGQHLDVPKNHIENLANSVAFLNTFDDITPTGISVDNLPYIVMIAAAMIAFAGLTVLKYRKGSKASA